MRQSKTRTGWNNVHSLEDQALISFDILVGFLQHNWALEDMSSHIAKPYIIAVSSGHFIRAAYVREREAD